MADKATGTDQARNSEEVYIYMDKTDISPERQKELERYIEELRKQIKMQEMALYKLDQELEQPGLLHSAKKLSDLSEESAKLRMQIQSSRGQLAIMTEELSRINDAIINSKHFDKILFFQNLRELLKHSDVKIGQIEKEAGIQTGYISRLEKSGNTTDPTAEFIVTAAEMLGVPIDLLVKSKIGSISQTEKTLMNFFERLILDTRNDNIIWNAETEKELREETYGIIPYNVKRSANPLISREIITDTVHGGNMRLSKYHSAFFPEKEVFINGTCYNGKLPHSDTKLYLMKCIIDEKSEKKRLEDYYEVYLLASDGKNNPICCTAKCPEALSSMIKSLYIEIQAAESHTHLTPETLDLIAKYLKYHTTEHS